MEALIFRSVAGETKVGFTAEPTETTVCRETKTDYKIISQHDGYFVFENVKDRERFHHGLGRLGVMDAAGSVLVEPRWRDIEILPKDGPAEVFVLDNGPAYFLLQNVHTGKRVNVKGKLLGFRDGVGQVRWSEMKVGVFDVAFSALTLFTDSIEPGERLHYSNIDINGEIIGVLWGPTEEYDENGDIIINGYEGYDCGLMPCGTKGIVHYYDKTGAKAFPGTFYHRRRFHEGLAAAAPYNRAQRKREYPLHGVLSTDGEWVVKPKYDWMDDYKNGYVRVAKSNPVKFGFLNKAGEECIPLVWDEAWEFGEDGLAPVRRYSPPQFSMIDGKGRVRCHLPIEVESVSEFCENRLRVQAGGKIGYLDYSGGWAIPAQYQSGTDFYNGIAAVRDEDGYRLIDLNGNVVKELGISIIGMGKGLCWTQDTVYRFGVFPPEWKTPRAKKSEWQSISEEALQIALEKMENGQGLKRTATLQINAQGDYIRCFEDLTQNSVGVLTVSVDGGEAVRCHRALAVAFEDGEPKYCIVHTE